MLKQSSARFISIAPTNMTLTINFDNELVCGAAEINDVLAYDCLPPEFQTIELAFS